MLKLKKLFFIVFCVLCWTSVVSAQILDDEDMSDSASNINSDAQNGDEELFNELFSDYSETERDISKTKNFGDALDQSIDIIKKSGAAEPIEEAPVAKKEVEPLEGDIHIGITKGSFNITNFQNRLSCSFSVTVKSNLNKSIKIMGLNLIYKDATFAFSFREVPANGFQERFIRTSGERCYTLAGVPDITVNKCKIYAAKGSECATRLVWDDELTPPDSKERRNFFGY